MMLIIQSMSQHSIHRLEDYLFKQGKKAADKCIGIFITPFSTRFFLILQHQ